MIPAGIPSERDDYDNADVLAEKLGHGGAKTFRGLSRQEVTSSKLIDTDTPDKSLAEGGGSE